MTCPLFSKTAAPSRAHVLECVEGGYVEHCRLGFFFAAVARRHPPGRLDKKEAKKLRKTEKNFQDTRQSIYLIFRRIIPPTPEEVEEECF